MKGFVNLTQTNDDKLHKIAINELVIAPYGEGFRAGRNARGSGVAIGGDTLAGGSCVAVGEDASASVFSTAIGHNAVAYGSDAMQLGLGSNYEPGTLQFRKFNIVGKDGKLYTNDGTESNVIMIPVASEQFVKDMLSGVAGGGLTLQVVDVLPTEEISTTTIYLVPNSSGTHDEYIYVNDTWEQIGTTAVDLSNYVTLEEYNKLVNNETQIKPNSNQSFITGGARQSDTKESIVIGYGAHGGDLQEQNVVIGASARAINASQQTAIGMDADCNGGRYGVALGYASHSWQPKAIQVGYGTNNTENTLQVYDDNIYNHHTHTLTVQNIELNGVNLGTQLGDLNTALEAILGV